MIKFKSCVRIHGISNEAMLGVFVAYSLLDEHGYDLVLTSVCDGKHSSNSLHYSGNAFDFRTRHINSKDEVKSIRNELAGALGGDYDVVLEATHIHVEYQPKHRPAA